MTSENPLKNLTDDELIGMVTHPREKYRYTDNELIDIAVYGLEEMRKRKITNNASYGKISVGTIVYECGRTHGTTYPQGWVITDLFHNNSTFVMEQLHNHLLQWPDHQITVRREL